VGYRSLSLTAYDFDRAFRKISGWFSKSHEKQTGNLKVLSPVCLPFGKSRLVRCLNSFCIVRAVRAHLNQGAKTIFITTLPSAADIVGRLGEDYSVYYCFDDLTLWPGSDRELTCKLEKELLSKVDLVVATSEKLQKTRKNGVRQTFLLDHGVDLDHFRKVSPYKRPEGSVPTVAYFGLIDERCDLELLSQVISKMRDVNFLIIGLKRVDCSSIELFPNVEFTGQIPYADLPDRLSRTSALILPYKLNALAESINPLKIKEYLATGLPVVSTPLPEVQRLSGFVSIASEAAQFITALRNALEGSSPPSADLDSYLAKNSWRQKASEFSAMIETLFS
jgi:glycosyltransferase involved in cell wall biosynthesis